MSLSYDAVEGFIDYVEYYPMEDELGYDGVHDGGYKGLKPDASESAVKAWNEYVAMIEEAEKQGIKL